MDENKLTRIIPKGELGEILDRFEVYNSVEVIAPEIELEDLRSIERENNHGELKYLLSLISSLIEHIYCNIVPHFLYLDCILLYINILLFIRILFFLIYLTINFPHPLAIHICTYL